MKAAAVCLFFSLALLAPVQAWLDRQPKPRVPSNALEDETLYVKSSQTFKGFSLGFNAVLADWYWLRTIQYFGGKLADDPAQWRFDALPALLNLVLELDPQYLAAYRFGAAFLPATQYAETVALLERGIRANPLEWRLQLDLGYLHWRQKHFAEAAAAYQRASRVPGAPAWLAVLAASVAAQGNDRATAREIFTRLYESSTDEYVRQLSQTRLQTLQAQTELEQLNRLLTRYQAQSGACPPSLAALVQWTLRAGLRAELSAELELDEHGAPVDPAGFAYAFEAGKCVAEFNAQSSLVRSRF
jgi:tetratricopeptide (TPR) repeat protein